MTPFERPDRRCPKCEHKGYMFRARRTVEAKPDEGGGKFVETKSRCRSCSHDWWEQDRRRRKFGRWIPQVPREGDLFAALTVGAPL